MIAMKANYEAAINSELSLKANVMHMSTTNCCIVSYCCHWDPKAEVNTRIFTATRQTRRWMPRVNNLFKTTLGE